MKSLRALLGLLLVVGGVYVAYKLIPPYFTNYQFQDMLESEARLSNYSAVQKNEEEIRAGVYKKAQDLEVPVLPEQIKVSRAGNEWVITADYTVHVDMAVHPVDLEFHATSKNR